jgi:hypothetical protein
MLEGAALSAFERSDEPVDLRAFSLSGQRAIRLQASYEDGEIACIAGCVADAFDEPQISAAVWHERSDVFERAAQPSRRGAQVVEPLAVEAALARATCASFKRRDTLVDESGGPGV